MQRSARAPLAFGFVAAVLMLITGALLYALFSPAANDVLSITGSLTTNQAATRHQNMMQMIWNNLAYYVLFIAMLFVVAKAYFESSGGRVR